MNKEEIYDAKISPLITQVIDICQQHKIAMFLSFAIPTEDDPDLACSTALLSKEYEPFDTQVKAFDMLMGKKSKSLMITACNQQGEIVGMTAVI
jgi:hypothetical protein